ncbi:MAG: ABC transporter permease [Chloroflexota bacterium]|nr:ABC transporter permease [Chloroflexota bacterium]
MDGREVRAQPGHEVVNPVRPVPSITSGIERSRRNLAPRRGDLGRRAATTAAALAAAAVVLFLLVPLGALLARAVGDRGAFTPETAATLRRALTLTLGTSAVALGAVLAFGTPLAYLLARRRFPGAGLVDALIDVPMVLPPAVAGLALLMAFGRRGVVGEPLAAVGITVGFTTAAVVLAQVFVAVPFYVRAARAGFARVDRVLEEAAADLGASPSRVFRTVTVPLARPSLVAGAVLAWARAVGEFGATILFAGNYPGRTQTMPLAVYGRFEAGDLPSALLLAAVLLGASLLVLLGVRLVGERGQEGIWR